MSSPQGIISTPAASGFDHRYWLIVALEAGALFGGLAVINGVLHGKAVSVAWVALVVGVHFFGLARIWRMPLYYWLGGAVAILSLAGFLIYALGGSAAIVGLVSGVAGVRRCTLRSGSSWVTHCSGARLSPRDPAQAIAASSHRQIVRCRPSCDRQASRPVAPQLADMCCRPSCRITLGKFAATPAASASQAS